MPDVTEPWSPGTCSQAQSDALQPGSEAAHSCCCAQVRLMEQLQASGLQAADIAGALRLRPQATPLDASEVLVDLRSDSALHWLNNLEAGRQYWGWSTHLTDLLRPQFTGQLHQVRRAPKQGVASTCAAPVGKCALMSQK